MSTFTFAGKEIAAEAGQSIGAALLAAGYRSWRTTRHGAAPRGLFCGIGICFDCLVIVNGRPNQRACLTEIRHGDEVEPQEGAGRGHLVARKDAFRTPSVRKASFLALGRGDYDIAVIGAGPAGLAAADAARRAGARVALLDAGNRIGGQYWRHRDGHSPVPNRLRDADFLPGHAVWHVERTDAGFTAHTTAGEVRSRKVIVATGAYDRQLPFPGWTLPGVFTAGGAQALLKGHGVAVGERVVVAGSGPFLLPVGVGLAAAGARVAGVFEAGSPLGFARHPVAVLRNLDKLAEGGGYLRALRRHRIPYRTRTAVLAAHGDDRVRAVTVASLDEEWRAVPGSEREVECDAVAVGYGFTPQLEIPLQLGCDTRLDADGSLVATVDDRQRATVPGVYLAGEVCGVGGAQLSLVEGELAGRHAAGAEDSPRLWRRRDALRTFAAAMHEVYRIRPGWLGWLSDDTLVCRCEEVSTREVRRSIVDLGATDPRTVKLLARPGMGLCQGRVCGYPTACLVAAAHDRPVTAQDLLGVSARPIAAPVTLGTVAEQPVEEA